MITELLVASTLFIIKLHGINGREVEINSHQITSLRAYVEGQENKLINEKVRCIINLTDGHFVSVIEDCDTVLKMLESRK